MSGAIPPFCVLFCLPFYLIQYADNCLPLRVHEERKPGNTRVPRWTALGRKWSPFGTVHLGNTRSVKAGRNAMGTAKENRCSENRSLSHASIP